MADWTKPFEASYTWWRVDRASYTYRTPDYVGDFYATGIEVEQIPNITSATLQLNDSTETFETGLAHCVGPLDVGNDLVRCHLVARFEDGTVEDVPLGTYDVSVPSRDVHGSYEECSAILDGRLIELQQDAFEEPHLVKKNANAWAYAAQWVRERGLTFSDDDPTVVIGHAATTTYTFGLGADGYDGGSVLSAYNSLMADVENLRAASTDPYGRVMLRNPIDYDGTPVWTFSEGVNATFLSDATDERDTSKVCNVVICVYEADDATTIGTAEDTDPLSPWSIANYGRRKCAVYTYQDSATQAQADAKAAELLERNRSIVRRVTISHVHCPARVGDIVEVSYPSAGIYGKFAIRTQTVEVGSAGCMTVSELRRFERA